MVLCRVLIVGCFVVRQQRGARKGDPVASAPRGTKVLRLQLNVHQHWFLAFLLLCTKENSKSYPDQSDLCLA